MNKWLLTVYTAPNSELWLAQKEEIEALGFEFDPNYLVPMGEEYCYAGNCNERSLPKITALDFVQGIYNNGVLDEMENKNSETQGQKGQ